MDISNLRTDVLAQHCAQQTRNYLLQLANDPRYCFELMRRALRAQDSEALTHLYQTYLPLGNLWARRHPRFDVTGESTEFFASAAMNNFYFALRGEKFDSFPSLAHALSYFKICVHSVIEQYMRPLPPSGPPIPFEHDPQWEAPPIDERIMAEELWGHVERILPDPDDRLLVHCRYVLDLKPAQIAAKYPSRWATAREVTVALQRNRRRLRRDPALRQLVLGDSSKSDDV